MKCVAVLFLCFIAIEGSRRACHGAQCHTMGSGEVDNAIVNINLHYNTDLCLEILLIDCAYHQTQGDEVICASNGKTYENHCHFAHARCEYFINLHHGGSQLSVVHAGSCSSVTPIVSVTTMQPSITTVAPASTTGSVMMTTAVAGVSGVTQGAKTTTTTSMPMTTEQTTTTTAATTTTMMPTTTTDPIGNIIQSVFCQQVDSINCSNGFKIVCASNGQFYPNDCELSKAKCKDPTLTIDSNSSNCSV